MSALALEHCGYAVSRDMILYEKLEPVGPGDVGILEQLGGRMIRASTWDQLGGMVSKTTFAKGIASRLGWPFVELFPSRLAGDSPAGLASALREAFALVAELDKVVVFIDEVEEIAGLR